MENYEKITDDVTEYEHFLEVRNLQTSFFLPAGEVKSVAGTSFNVDKGKILGIVGESGSGKSVTAYSIMQILSKPGMIKEGSSIKVEGRELVGLPEKELAKIRGGKISIIFQDPMTSLNPVYTIGNQLREAIRLHTFEPVMIDTKAPVLNEDGSPKVDGNGNQVYEIKQTPKTKKVKRAVLNENGSQITDTNGKKIYEEVFEPVMKPISKQKANAKAIEMLTLVGINSPEKRLKQYPFEFSGGMLQRIMIAMALCCNPDLLIADEPTTALDVTIQAQILELIQEIQRKMGMAVILITHDLGVVAQLCDEVLVMYGGKIVERGTADEIFYNPKHEYTKGLLKSIPTADGGKERLVPITGSAIDLLNLPKGCAFSPRCTNTMKICLEEYPTEQVVNHEHLCSCFMYVKEMMEEAKKDLENLPKEEEEAEELTAEAAASMEDIEAKKNEVSETSNVEEVNDAAQADEVAAEPVIEEAKTVETVAKAPVEAEPEEVKEEVAEVKEEAPKKKTTTRKTTAKKAEASNEEKTTVKKTTKKTTTKKAETEKEAK